MDEVAKAAKRKRKKEAGERVTKALAMRTLEKEMNKKEEKIRSAFDYIVKRTSVIVHEIYINAKTEEEALAIAKSRALRGDFDNMYVESREWAGQAAAAREAAIEEDKIRGFWARMMGRHSLPRSDDR